MADEEGPTEQELEASRRASAQDAAGDLARMGVDPRLLGLDPVTSPPQGGQPQATEPPPSSRTVHCRDSCGRAMLLAIC